MSDPRPAPETPTAADWTHLLVCRRCLGPLDRPGALVFSPPLTDDTVLKTHLCADCYPLLVAWVAEHAESMRDDAMPGRPHDGRLDGPVTRSDLQRAHTRVDARLGPLDGEGTSDDLPPIRPPVPVERES